MQDERAVRLEKLATLRSQGIDPYPSSASGRTALCADVRASFETWLAEGKAVTLAGRIMITRVHGAMLFADLCDASGSFQIQLTTDRGEEMFNQFRDLVDPGDFIQASGTLFRTKRGEETLAVASWKMLTKAILPLPEKWHGLQDVETRYREREIDLIANAEVRNRFIVRSKLVSSLRRFLDAQDFLEVETPILQSIPGGANARPFITHHQALDIDLYLRIAPELYLKRLVVGGFEKVYEIGRSFRNEGIDYAHNPEFTTIELYWAFVEKDRFVTFMEEMVTTIVQAAVGSTKMPYEQGELDFAAPWKKTTFREAVRDACGIDIDQYHEADALIGAVREKGIKVDFAGCVGIGEHYDQLFKKTARAGMTQPTWVFDYPVDLKPLAKRSPADPTKSACVQLVVQGAEIINAYYHELNDPVDQRERFQEQERMRLEGSEEAQRIDESFLRALEHGMPPTSGMAIGIDRLAAFITDSPNLKEVILFPTLRPEGAADGQKAAKKELQVAHAVLLQRDNIPAWSTLNTAAHLAASFAAREGKRLIGIDVTETQDGEKIPMNIQHAIMMKETPSSHSLLQLKRDAEQAGLAVVCFTQAMQDSTNDRKVKAWHEEKRADDLALLGVLLFGPKSAVEELTRTFTLVGAA